ncbi:MAG: cupredoxin domain-containing protein [Chloroflexi bacterium]|nr:cupredoxin domain-containing protein [Chloroflexota bacterium]
MHSKKMLAIPILLLVALLLGACTATEAAVSVTDVEQLRQQITTLQSELLGLRQESQELKQQATYQQRVLTVLLMRVEPDVSTALTAHIRGFEGDEGMKNPRITVREGELVRVNLANGEPMMHDFVIDGMAHSSHLEKAGDATMVVFLAGEAGEYTYYCSVPGHRQAGMEGVLVVEPGHAEEGMGMPMTESGAHSH